jgi:hypothetical protein
MLNLIRRRDGLCENITFFVFCLSTVFMIFFSTRAVQVWSAPWNRMSILSACLTPVFLLLLCKTPEWLNWQSFKKNLLIPSIIVLLGMLNIVFSEERSITLKVMTLFLISGSGVFVVSSGILNNRFRQDLFLWLCWVCFILLCIYGFFEFQTRRSILLLSYNPIPAGSLLILLSVGPLLLFVSHSNVQRFFVVCTLVLGIAMIAMIGKRGTVLGLLAMALIAGFTLPWKKSWLIIPLALILFSTGYLMRDHLNPQLTKHYIKDPSTLLRAENYIFAGSIWIKKPLFGTGLHAPLANYLEGYHPSLYKTQRPISYSDYIKKTKTFENIILLGFVEMGSLFSIAYLTLIAALLKKMFTHVRKNPGERLRAILLLAPLFGFFIHSMTFDSIIYPHLNWLVHSLFGLMANFAET